MLRNINIIVTNRCNSRCRNCNIWKKENKDDELWPEDIAGIFKLDGFERIEEVGLSGGEPFLRKDINEIILAIVKNNKALKSLYLTTNASMRDRVLDTCELICDVGIENPNIGVSLEGTQEVNRIVRGVDSYNNAINLLKDIKNKYPSINTSISLTICKENCKEDILEHVYNLSKELDCGFSFRLAAESDYYGNEGQGFKIDSDSRKMLIKFIMDHDLDDEYMREQVYYLLTGKIPVMYDYQANKNICLAGKKFIFIQSNGDFYPCMYSNEVIGNYKEGIVKNKDFYKAKECPCMTECTVWPMLLK